MGKSCHDNKPPVNDRHLYGFWALPYRTLGNGFLDYAQAFMNLAVPFNISHALLHPHLLCLIPKLNQTRSSKLPAFHARIRSPIQRYVYAQSMTGISRNLHILCIWGGSIIDNFGMSELTTFVS